MTSISIYLTIIIILFIFLVLSFRISLFMARRAVCSVISTFRENNATEFQKAMTLDNLGLAPRPFLSLRLLRDYKPWALRALVQSGIIRMAAEGTFYLSEDTLRAYPHIESACSLK